MSILDLRSSASHILGAAVLEVFPGTTLVESHTTDLGFYYDFVFPFEFKAEFLSLIEEKMRQIVKEKREVKKLEMLPSNAAEFFRHKKQQAKADHVSQIKRALISIIQIGDYISNQEFNYPSHTGLAVAFKIPQFLQRGEQVRILGTAFPSKDELKAFFKQDISLEPVDGQKLFKEMRLFDYENNVWLPKGEFIRHFLKNYWREELLKQNFQFVASSDFDVHFKLDLPKVAEFLEDADQVVMNYSEKDYNSSLQFILNIFKILRLKENGYDRDVRKERGRIVYSLFGGLTRFITYVVEQHRGHLPWCIAPEQVRVLAIGDAQEYAERITCNLRSIGIRVTVDSRDEQLKTRVRDALLEKIPFVVVIGDKELKTASVTVRRSSEGFEKSMPLEEFLELIRRPDIEN